MLIRFEVENHLSFKDKQTLSMIATKNDDMKDSHCIGPKSRPDLMLLKAAAVYGPNASGKSNLIKAISFMREFVTESHAGERIADRTEFDPFRLDSQSLKQPGRFEIAFVLEDEVYEYSFTIDQEKVIKESLLAYPQKKRVLLFQREVKEENDLALAAPGERQVSYTYKFGDRFKGEKNKLTGLTRKNALYLSVGAQFAHPLLEKIFKWFKEFLKPVISPHTVGLVGFTSNLIEENPILKQKVVSFLKAADLGIKDVKIEKVTKDQINFEQIPDTYKKELEKDIEAGKLKEIIMTHAAALDNREFPAEFGIDEESLGTQRMFQLSGPWLHTLQAGGILLVDEFEASLHPNLQEALLTEFFESASQCQIIFTTHNVELLEKKLLRRDEVWFTEKRADGSTDLFSLADFKPKLSQGKSIKNGYLNGAYGALPILGDLIDD